MCTGDAKGVHRQAHIHRPTNSSIITLRCVWIQRRGKPINDAVLLRQITETILLSHKLTHDLSLLNMQ